MRAEAASFPVMQKQIIMSIFAISVKRRFMMILVKTILLLRKARFAVFDKISCLHSLAGHSGFSVGNRAQACLG